MKTEVNTETLKRLRDLLEAVWDLEANHAEDAALGRAVRSWWTQYRRAHLDLVTVDAALRGNP